jgi:uncharacterized protein
LQPIGTDRTDGRHLRRHLRDRPHLLAEPEARAIRDLLTTHDTWWSSELLVVELRRLAARESLEARAEEYLEALQLVPVDSLSLQRASRVEPTTVRSLDAIHLEAALQLQSAVR